MDYLKKPVNFRDKRHILTLVGTLIIFLTIPLTVILVQQTREPTSRASTTPNDPKFSSQWALPKIRAPEAWDITKGSATIKVAVVDGGITSTLADLQGQLGTGYNAITPGGSTEDDVGSYGSGTQAAGIMGARTNNGVDMAGSSWNITMLPVRVCDMFGCRTADKTAEGIRWATANGAQIIDVSLAWSSSTAALDAAVADAISRGILVVATAGDYYPQNASVGYPAALPGVIAVGATDSTDTVWSSSSRGAQLDIIAPGVSVLTLVKDGCCLTRSGTRLAAAHVSGALALLLSQGISPTAAVAALYQGAVDLGPAGRDDTYGWGRLDACGALNAAGFTCPVTGGGDTLSPTVNITNPTGVQTVSGTVNVGVNATDN
ncbi:hypothetical protein A2994_01560 [candidate division Kazan bacterium RIFCSPLOWO2_01_FULL_48_13]|uniref:Peptidase S8/S53 domain-containing protein n=1 Tax=candidate division Kazan bacterium RIFCSPLOWO2_01_FULL_48_13 TaxID=1798539 RepID=A0A1F4PMZ2_UNCK3|nr:MAG: hypothetical protein A2994_01560 [candidate division Kazan bacterium RIFCSPLOWO2_01_FULL_48_13]